ncbi:type I polyketide synthase, partial [Streptomyces celluloflavus]
ASFAMMVSLAAVWRAHGVRPDAVIGHSQGEIAAAVVSGALSLEDGARVVALRSQAIGRRLAGRGGMMSVPLPVAEVEERLGAWDGRVSVAAVNGPRSVVVSGEPDALDELFEALSAEEVRVRRIAVDYASHSAQVEDLREELLDVLAPVQPRRPEVPFLSTMTGDWLETAATDAEYWHRNLRQTVRFEEAVRNLLGAEYRSFIEVSSHPVLIVGIQDMIDDTVGGQAAVAVGTLRRDEGGLRRVYTSLAEAFVRGVPVDWAAAWAGTDARRVDLPTYAFQHEHFWLVPADPEGTAAADPADAAFWTAVEQADLETLTRSLHIDEESLAAVLPALSTWRRQRRDRSTVDAWRYRVDWRPLDVPARPALSGTWLLVSAEGVQDEDVSAALTDSGAQVRRLVLDESCVDRAVLVERLAGVGDLAGVVSVVAGAEQASEGYPGLSVGLALTVALVQGLGDAELEAPLWCLTRGAVSTGRSDRVINPDQAQVLGVGWTAALEHPQRVGGVVDLPVVVDRRAGQRLAAVLAGAGGEDQLAVRGSGVFARRIVRAAAEERRPAGTWTPRGTTLITGGTGTLARHVARWLAGQGAERLVLVSRRGPQAPGASELVAELAESGTEATVVGCDVADRDAVAALLVGLKADGHTLRNVVHTAAVIELQTLAETGLDEFARVVDAKVAGARHLDELLADDALDSFVLFSSTAGMWGSGRHAAYVAGNAFLGALADNRRARGLTGTALSWGIWADDLQLGRVDPQQIRRSGLEFMDPELALAGLRRALDDDETAVAVADVDWDVYHPVYTSTRPTTLFDEIPDVRQLTEAAARADGPAGEAEFAARLRALPAAEQERLLLDLVRGEAATVLGHTSSEALSDRRAFRDVGFDSLTAVGLRNRLAAVTGLTLPTTMVFDHPNPAALAGFLRAELAGTEAPPAAAAAPSATDDDPIVIVGMSCRYPGGVTSPDQLWDLVLDGTDAISGFPEDRGWDADGLYDPDPDSQGKSYSVQGGFLRQVADFDAGFFGISPREALAMDPQQRLLLETAWEAFERAGIDPVSVRSTLTGTFIGASYQDYAASDLGAAGAAEGHMVTGTLPSILSGRVAYLFGLEGPAVTLDTACSSSLVAIHLACQSLRNGESTLALAGGVSIMATPNAFIGFSRQRALAADGRCKAYADAADGMTLAEGVGLVLLERLSDARRNGHDVLAVVRGSAMNQDGASNGLTAPNGPSQQRVIRHALADAGLRPDDVDALEGHGTGTALGDPIEAQALLATYGQDRTRPLLLGSVKSNIGHTQMASGVASVIKMVEALRHGVLPRTLHAETPSSHVDWSAGAIDLLTEQRDWPQTGHPRRGGVSSFGLGGTNVHTILEQAPPADEPAAEPADGPAPAAEPVPLLVSARSDAALRAQAGRLLSFVADRPGLHLTDLGYALATTRAALEHRAAVVAGDHGELLRALTALRDGAPAPGLLQGTTGHGGLAFLFTGQGSQRPGMGRELYDRCPVFADALDAVLARFDATTDRPLREVIFAADGTPEAALLDLTGYAQPALFAVEVALFRLVESWGVRPDYLAGHSIGELAAAHVAGVLSLADACTLVAARGRLMQALPPGGAMVAVQTTEDEVLPLLTDRVSVAAVNGPSAVVIAGDEDAVLAVAAHFAAEGRKTKRLRVSHAFHSPRMDAMLDDFATVAGSVSYHPPRIPFVSNVTGALATDEQVCSPRYWVDHVRHAVRFADGVAWLAERDVRTFLELGPDGVLCGMARESLTDERRTALLPLLRRDRDEVRTVTAALSGVQVRGVTVDWAAYFAAYTDHADFAASGARPVKLPTYAFQRERFWPERTAAAVQADAVDAEFWSAVEQQDVASLAAALELDGDTVTAMVPALTAWRRRRDEQSRTDTWRYRVTWKPLTAPTAPTATPGPWLVLSPAGTADDAWCTAVTDALGDRTVRIEVTAPDRAALGERLAELPLEAGEFTGILSLLAVVDEAPDADVPAGLLLTATAVQALGDAGIDAPLWCVTRGAVSVGRSEPVRTPEQAAVWGLGRVVGLEHPQRWGGLADLPEHLDATALRRLVDMLTAERGEDQVAVRASGVYARRLTHSPAAGEARRAYSPTGTVLVTGGTGGLGSEVARWLAQLGAEHLLLTSRRGPDAPGAAELRRELAAAGAQVTLTACDAADRDALAAVLAGIPEDRPLTAVFHTAGVVEDGVVAALTPQDFAAVLRAKTVAARHLDELTEGMDLSAFVLFSSTAGVIGAAGQGNYAAANAYLDALAERRRARGRTATSVAWGPWAGAGMVAGTADIESRVRRGGFAPLPPRQAIAALQQAIEHDDTTVAIADIDWRRFVRTLAAARPVPFVADLPEVREDAAVVTGPDAAGPREPELRQRLAALPAAERADHLLDLLRTLVAGVLGHTDAGRVEPERAFKDLGFDSLTALELRNGLSAATGLNLPASLVYDSPTPLAMARFLLAELDGSLPETAAPPATTAPAADDPVVVVGMSCRFPGGVATPEELWQLLADGRDGISAFPTDRGWDLDTLAAGASATREGGFLTGAAEFDARFFGISPREALAMDPQQRLLLETSWEALERAGIDPATLRGTPAGVFVGTNGQDYSTVLRASDADVQGYVATGTTASVMSGRLSYALGLEGPAVTVDTACSSSLVALHWAAKALHAGECTLALAGGVSVMSSPDSFIEFSTQGGLAPDGRCKAFADGADGTAWSEGAGVLVLERLSDAVRNGHEIRGIIRGTAVNQDGASNGLTAPNGPAQQRVIRQALADAGLTAAEVDAVEAHGTGTTLGDPIEAHALLTTYGQQRAHPLLLGAVKSNIGHTQAAAGVAGVIKMLLAMRHGTLPKTLHLDAPSSHVDWSAGAVELLAEATAWPRTGHPRRAGVSAFGVSGTNAHVIIEQAPAAEPAAARPAATAPALVPWVVSGRTQEALRQQIERLTAFTADDGAPSPVDVGYSLATGRTAFPHRAVLLAADGGVTEAARGTAGHTAGKTAFLFSGQGSQRAGMGRELYAHFPVFAEALDAVLAHLDTELARPLREVLFAPAGTPEAELLNDTGWTQPALFAIEVALFRLVESWGVRPDFVAGHSIGELTAAHVAGVLALPDACRLVAARATLMQQLPTGGAMVAVQATEDEITPLLDASVALAAVNGPDALVIAGAEAAVLELAARFAEQGRRTRRLRVSHAFHSPLMDPMLADFARIAGQLEFRDPQVPVVSNLTGRLATDEELTSPAYWVRHVREAVRFADGVRTLRDAGVTAFVELGPDGVLAAMAQQSLDGAEPAATVVPVLRADRDEAAAVTTALARLHVGGVAVDWSAFFAGSGARRVDLPTYAFQRERFWPARAAARPGAPDAADTEFWSAVEDRDVDALAATLELDGDTVTAMVPALSSWRRRRTEQSASGTWRYRETWTALSAADSAPPHGRRLVLVPAGAARDAWVTAVVDALGEDAVRVEAGDLATAHRDGAEYTGVVSLLAAAEPTAPEAAGTGIAALPPAAVRPTALLTALAEAGIDAPLWCVTRGAVAVGATEHLAHPGQAAVWGEGQVAALEEPERWGGLIDLPEALDAPAAARFVRALGGPDGEDQLAVRATGTYARRLVRAPAGPGGSWKPAGTVLVVGGTSPTGRGVARWLAREGAGHLVVTAGPGLDPAETALLTEELTPHGTTLTVATCDPSDRAALAAVLDAVPQHAPLTAVIHAADDTDTAATLTAVGHLDDLLGDRPLDAFVLFSSVAGVWGVRGQGERAALGARLAAFARQRRDRGVPALSVAWGAWADGTEPSLAAHLRLSGLPPMAAEPALAALGRAVADDESAVTVADVVWEVFAPAATAQRRSRFFAELPEARTAIEAAGRDRADEAAGAFADAYRRRLLALSDAERSDTLRALVRTQVAEVLGHSSTDVVEDGLPFRDLGFDSLTAVDLRTRLAAATGLTLPATLVFDHPTPAELADHLHTQLMGDQGNLVEPATPAAVVRPADDDPIAIIGMSCRYPGGVRSPEDLWRLVSEGIDAVGELPTDRGWDLDALLTGRPGGHGGRSATGHGGFLYDAAEFDPGFFGISPREALVMDPQQRIVLEAAWEALERAGIDPATLRGSGTGVYVGGGSGDYRPPEEIGQWQTAQSASLLSGRLAYSFGLQGPTVSVDTACSSSLVALHLAAQALRSGECSIALAGGVTVMATPAGFVEFSAQGALSPDGRCKAFSDDADGTGWAEGVGMLVVERLSEARRNGHRVLAVLRGSAINQDGASNGLTAPSGPAQQRVIRQALANAGLAPADVDAVEAHGTGTKLGDPIEAQALLATYGQDRDPQRPLLLGSLKSNIGHTQAASGVAGVIKMVMAMRHGTLPRTLHAQTPSSHVDWTAGAATLLTAPATWPDTGRPRRAGVSSFGASGTNAHVILEQAPAAGPEAVPAGPDRAAGLLPVLLSGRTAGALRDQARSLLAHTDAHPDTPLADLAFSLATTRSAFEHRAVLPAAERAGLRAGLAALAAGTGTPQVIAGETGRTGKLAFLFSGQGSQRLGMGRELYERFPAFADALDTVLGHLDAELKCPLRDVLWGTDAELLNSTGFTQPALFAIEVALFRLVESWGVRPDFVAGHSIGEIAAAHVAGVFSLADACRLVVARAWLMEGLPAGGAMVAVQATEDEVTPLLTDRVSIAAVNGPTSVVVSGAERDALDIAERLGRKKSRLPVSHAFHSPLMDPVLDEFRAVVAGLTFTPPALPVVSNLTGAVATAEELCSPEYWVRHVREAVRFADGVRELAARGVTAYLELGPDGVLSALARETLPDEALTVPVLRKGRDEEATAVTALARLHVHGSGPHWSAFFAGTGARHVELPTYAFQHGRFWPAAPAGRALPAADEAGATDHAFWAAVAQEDFASLESVLDIEGDALAKVLPALLDWRRQQQDRSVVDGWRHRIAWQPLTGVTTGGPAGTWLAVLPEDRADDPWVTAALDALGTEVVRVTATAPDRAALAAELAGTGRKFTGVLSLLALDETAPDGVPTGLLLTAALLQALGDAGIDAPLWCVTRGAVSVGRAEELHSPAQAAVWGLGRVAALEYPERWGGLIDLPVTPDERTAARFAAVLAGRDGEDQAAVRAAAVFAPRLVAAPADRSAGQWNPAGTVLITGGTGALGTHVARRLAHDGVPHLVLLSRRGPQAPHAAELRAELDRLGTRVTFAAADAADRAQLTAVLADIPAEHPLTAVVHTAGVLDDGILDRLTPDRFAAVFRAKVTSALLLDELTRDLDLSAFVLFSSATAAVGNPGQANYAAANTVLDALAVRRRALGFPATSIAWGAWGGGGMADGAAADEAARRAGIGTMDPQLACAALWQLVAEAEPTAVVADVALERYVGAFGARPSALLRDFPGYRELVAAAPDEADGAPDLADRLAALPPARRLDTVVELVRTRAAQVLGHPDQDAVGAERSFRDLGVDSLGAVELRNQLNAATGLRLSATLVFDHPTPAALGAHVLQQLVPEEGPMTDHDETEIRAVLASVPIDRLRDSGVLEPLLRLVGRDTPPAPDASGEAIDSMAVADLVRAALNGQTDL